MTTLHVLTVPGLDPLRDANVEALRGQSEVCLHADPERKGVLWNWATALTCSVEAGERWSLIVQDDALPIEGWQSELSLALHYSPEPIIGLTHFGSYGKNLAARGYPYGFSANALWGAAAGYRSNIIKGLLQLATFAQEIGWNPNSDDGVVIAFNALRGGSTAMTSRAVFDQNEEIRSTLGHHTSIRHPELTIRDQGPWWGVTPRAAKMHTRTSPPDVVELATAWRARAA
jgi:hypothetical protein